ncbi:hypothetical protein F5146DRAFT_500272 [Armillaria mellea]|nr:hypothetical protein F5146DRAFT_500272 [Armillaria mellea]
MTVICQQFVHSQFWGSVGLWRSFFLFLPPFLVLFNLRPSGSATLLTDIPPAYETPVFFISCSNVARDAAATLHLSSRGIAFMCFWNIESPQHMRPDNIP